MERCNLEQKLLKRGHIKEEENEKHLAVYEQEPPLFSKRYGTFF